MMKMLREIYTLVGQPTMYAMGKYKKYMIPQEIWAFNPVSVTCHTF
jgi:hypothetical protein